MAGIIEAKAVISAEDRTGAVFDAIAKKMKHIGDSAKVSAEVDRLAKSLGSTGAQLAALDRAAKAQAGFDAAKGKMQAHAAALRDVGRAMSEVEKPTREMARANREAQASFDRSIQSFRRQRSALGDAASGLTKLGLSTANVVGEQNRLRSAIDATNAALHRQLAVETRHAARREARRDAAGTIATGVGILAATRGKDFGKKAIVSAAEFDIGVRKQRAFTDITTGDQAPLIAQAKQIGQETPFSNLDVVKAQTKAMQGLPSGFSSKLKTEVAQGILENVKNYALVMESDLEHSAEAVRSYLLATGKDIGTKEKALAEASKATNQLVKMAKLGGMNDEDVQQFMKFAASSGSTAGLSTDTLMSLAALARRGGLRGDEAGVFVRSASSKLVSPTRQGLSALNAAGINFGDFVSMPGRLDAGRLEGQFQRDMGVKFTSGVRAKLDKVLADPAILGDRGAFTTAVTEAMAEQFGKTKKGTMRPADRINIAKAAGTFYKMSAESVNTEGLLDAIMRSNMTLPQLNSFLTDKHGGKGAITQRQWDEFKSSRQEIAKAGDDPNFAKSKADLIMGGLGGALENLKGSTENVINAFGQANEGLLKFSFDKLGTGLDALSNMSTEGKQVATVFGVIAGTGTAVYSGFRLMSAVLGAGGLGASAAALTTSAGLLDAAAMKLAGGSLTGAAGSAAGAAGAARGSALARLATLPALGAAGIGLGVIAGSMYALDHIGPKSRATGRGFQALPEPQTGLGPASWGSTDVSGGLGGEYGPYASVREKTWMETIFGPQPRRNSGKTDNGWRSDGTMPLPSTWMPGGGGARTMPDLSAITAKVVDPVPVKVEGSAFPMMVTIKVDGNGQVVGGDTRNVPVTIRGGSTGTSMPGARPQGFAPTMSGV